MLLILTRRYLCVDLVTKDVREKLPTSAPEPPKEGDQTLSHLSVLEEDDEFKEFAVQGE